jgi:phosphonate degradation associated HDIG domain protein
MNAPTVERVLGLLREEGSVGYFGEDVTLTEHQLQSAHRAELEGASQSLVIAALVHDIGWIVQAVSPDRREIPHEQLGAEWLSSLLPPSVTEPIRLHVEAKRYLCATRPDYHATLSETSQRTLVAQGGPLEADGVREFERNPHAADALQLRHWDDLAKVPGASTPDLDHYAPLLAELAVIGTATE